MISHGDSSNSLRDVLMTAHPVYQSIVSAKEEISIKGSIHQVKVNRQEEDLGFHQILEHTSLHRSIGRNSFTFSQNKRNSPILKPG
jgi:hypothetical protein